MGVAHITLYIFNVGNAQSSANYEFWNLNKTTSARDMFLVRSKVTCNVKSQMTKQVHYIGTHFPNNRTVLAPTLEIRKFGHIWWVTPQPCRLNNIMVYWSWWHPNPGQLVLLPCVVGYHSNMSDWNSQLANILQPPVCHIGSYSPKKHVISYLVILVAHP